MKKENVFAQKELKKYWCLLTGEQNCCIALENENTHADDKLYERYEIHVTGGVGYIKGVNARSVLLGVYHFFRELGCRFLYPGADGEYIPTLKAEDVNLSMTFSPKYRHRGITIEGSCSLEHVLNLIDWSAKNGFNSYFIQFRVGYTFFERWYYHSFNPYLEKEEFNDTLAEEYNQKIRDAMAERDMIYHAVGHGWTCEPLGIPSRGWDEGIAVPEQYRKYLALVKGKREFYKGVPLNTNLCYSQPVVRKMMIDNMVEYLQERKDVDVLHVWLGDNWNNYCECEDCKKKMPSDWYLTLLNELDAELTRLGMDTKIVFLCYFELLLPPQTERFINQDRFILMFAPITRTYMRSYASETETARAIEPKGFVVNDFTPPTNVAENISYLYAWQKIFQGDSFVFDYPLMWDECKDYGGIVLAKTIYGDINALQKMGLNGYISCQIQRAFFPTGFCMYMLGKTLYEDGQSYEEIQEDFFRHSFDNYAKEVYTILEEISSYKIYAYMRNDVPFTDKDTHDEMPRDIQRAVALQERVEEMMLHTENKFVLRNLRLVSTMLELCKRTAEIIFEKSAEQPNEEKIITLKKQLQLWIFRAENGVETRMDGGYLYTHVDEMSMRK